MHPWKPRFFAIWTGQAFSLLGSSLVSFALIWWLTERTNSETVLAAATLVTLLPPILRGPFAGALVDRWSRRAVMIGADVMIALLLCWPISLGAAWHRPGTCTPSCSCAPWAAHSIIRP